MVGVCWVGEERVRMGWEMWGGLREGGAAVFWLVGCERGLEGGIGNWGGRTFVGEHAAGEGGEGWSGGGSVRGLGVG